MEPKTLREESERALAVAGEFLYPEGDPEREAEFISVFGHATSKEAPPYETHYGSAHLFQQTHTLADLAGFYRAFGLQVVPGSERIDHVSCELEFLAFLLRREALALESPREADAQVCREARAKFVREHLATWIPAFCARLRERSSPRFTAAADRLRAILADQERDLGIAETGSDRLQPVFPAWTPETDCQGCPMARESEGGES